MPSEQLPQVTRIYQNHHLDSTRWEPYAPRYDDIVISTSIKSGTTWTQAIVSELIVHSLDSHNADTPKQAPLPDKKSSLWIDACFSGEIERLYQELEAQTHRRFLKTHLPLDGLPFYAQVKYLVIGRDARDVFMSLWNHYTGYVDGFYESVNGAPDLVGEPFPRCPKDIHAFWRSWISQGWFDWEEEGYPFWSNMHHAQTWWNYRHLDNIEFFHYADMLADPAAEIKRMADFLDIAVSDELLSLIVQQTSLSAMRQRNQKDGPHPIWKEGANTFYFKGTNGRWRDVLSEDELAMYEATKSKVLSAECARWLEQGRVALRHTRYQGAIVKDDQILLIKHTEHESGRSFWVIPGGGREAGETEMACVEREMWEETNLVVRVERLLVETVIPNDPFNFTRKTFLCHIISGEAAPGYEPEADAAAFYAITEVAWFDLRSEESWEASIFDNYIAYPMLQEIRRELGYV